MPHRRLPLLASSSLFAVLAALAPACSDDAVEPARELCPLTGATLLVPAPADWDLSADDPAVGMQQLDDRLLYHFGPFAQADRELVELCGGEPERIPVGDRYDSVYVLDTPDGKLLFGKRPDAPDEAIDRLDVPGLDTPRPVAGLPTFDPQAAEALTVSTSILDRGALFEYRRSAATILAAGIGSAISQLYYFDGDVDGQAVRVGDDILRDIPYDDRIYTHGDDGQVRVFHRATGEREVLLEDVRYIEPITDSEGRLHLIYQVLGDDQSEPVRVFDIGARQSRDVTVNDFAAVSWGRAGDDAGRWWIADSKAGSVMAQIGPGGAFIEAYRLDTLAALEVPDHLRHLFIGGDGTHFGLVLADEPDDYAVALWEPLTGALTELYRGPKAGPFLREGERVRYAVDNADDTRRWFTVDLATGETKLLLPRVGPGWTELPDGRLLTSLPTDDGKQVAVVDLDTAVYTTLVERTKKWTYADDFGVVYLDVEADQPGLWAVPLPPK